MTRNDIKNELISAILSPDETSVERAVEHLLNWTEELVEEVHEGCVNEFIRTGRVISTLSIKLNLNDSIA